MTLDQLTPEDQRDDKLVRQLSVEEKMDLLRAAQVEVAVNQEPSVRREDWYSCET